MNGIKRPDLGEVIRDSREIVSLYDRLIKEVERFAESYSGQRVLGEEIKAGLTDEEIEFVKDTAKMLKSERLVFNRYAEYAKAIREDYPEA